MFFGWLTFSAHRFQYSRACVGVFVLGFCEHIFLLLPFLDRITLTNMQIIPELLIIVSANKPRRQLSCRVFMGEYADIHTYIKEHFVL